MKEKLVYARDYINSVIRDIENAPQKEAIVDLLKVCQSLDEYYKEYCDELDVANGDEVGTAYRDDPNVEFYIDTSNWHDISLALRKLNLGAKEIKL